MHFCIFPVSCMLIGQHNFGMVGVVVLRRVHNTTAAFGSIAFSDYQPSLHAI